MAECPYCASQEVVIDSRQQIICQDCGQISGDKPIGILVKIRKRAEKVIRPEESKKTEDKQTEKKKTKKKKVAKKNQKTKKKTVKKKTTKKKTAKSSKKPKSRTTKAKKK